MDSRRGAGVVGSLMERELETWSPEGLVPRRELERVPAWTDWPPDRVSRTSIPLCRSPDIGST